MNHNGFQIEDDQRTQGYMKVSYSAERAKQELAAQEKLDIEKPGIFARVGKAFGLGSDNASAADAQNLQVLVAADESSVRVTVRTIDGKPMPHHDADKWLRLVRANLL